MHDACACSFSAALNIADKCGSIDVGKQADFVLLNTPEWEHIIYEMGDLACIADVFKLGVVVSKLSLP
jgi:imidazolonepropionase